MLKFIQLIQYAPALFTIINDAESDVKNPSEANLSLTVQDAEATVKKIFPNTDPKVIDAYAAIILDAITLEGDRSASHVEAVLIDIATQLSTALNLPIQITLKQ